MRKKNWEVASIAEQKSGGYPVQRQQWTLALQQLQECQLPDDLEETVVRLAHYPTDLQVLAKACHKMNQAQCREALEEGMNESPHPLSEWAEALLVLLRHIQNSRQSVPSICHALGYIACCDEALRMAPTRNVSLPTQVEQMLSEFGYEGE